LIGIKPEAVDISDPELPSGTTAQKIAAGIDATLADMKARGWEGAFCSILADQSAEATIAASLAETWDCIVIGGGIRVPSRGLHLFERVINVRPPRRLADADRIQHLPERHYGCSFKVAGWRMKRRGWHVVFRP